jgi:hypothetical protein
MKISLLIFNLFFFIVNIYAEPVDTVDAKQIAINFFQYKNPNKSWAGVKQTIIKNYKGITTRYTFVMENNSFVVVSADNSVVPILVYSDNGTFSEDHSPSFDYWMQTEYDELIVYNRINNVSNQKAIQEWSNIRNKNFNQNKTINAVSPLIKTKWGQSYPNDGYNVCAYNYYIQNSSCGCGHCTAGCVATAMAQIMKFWQDTDNDFDWCNMPNELFYNNGHNLNYNIQRNAVAELIADCGDKAEMDYCSNGNCSSSSTIGKGKQAFKNDYNYSNDMMHRYRWLTINWKPKMRNSLDDGQPIFYGGNSDDGGHAFVCDGYDGDDYFHFNWGWRGANDGYFYIKDNDGDPVIDYHKWQEAVFYLHPESSSIYCVDCSKNITISNVVTANNPYNSNFPYIQWSGISSLYNYTSIFPFPNNRPFFSDIISESGETRLEYFDIAAGTIHADNVTIPDKVNVHLKAYDEIVLTNFSTEEGAEFTAEIIPCPNSSGSEFANLGNKNIEQLETKFNKKFERVFEIFPNPCTYETNIKYSVKENENFKISVINIFGQVELSLINGKQSEDVYNLTFNTKNLKAGIYFCTLKTDTEMKTLKLIKQ